MENVKQITEKCTLTFNVGEGDGDRESKTKIFEGKQSVQNLPGAMLLNLGFHSV